MQQIEKSEQKGNFCKKEFPQQTITQAISYLHYGTKVIKYKKNFTVEKPTILYILEDDIEFLQWLSTKKHFSQTRISLFDIIDILEPVQQQQKQKPQQEDNLKLIIQTQKKILNLKFENLKEKDFFWQGLILCFEQAKIYHLQKSKYDSFRLLAESLFIKADDNGDKSLDANELHDILQKLQITISKKEMQKFFGTVDANKDNRISLDEFETMLQNYFNQPAIKALYNKYSNEIRKQNISSEIGAMTTEDYIKFCKDENNEKVTETDIERILEQRYNNANINNNSNINKKQTQKKKIQNITQQIFQDLLMTPQNSIFDPEKQIVYQNMGRPMTDYYINSSHNTYLLDNQLTGTSSIQAYKLAFQRGSRCVELDCWDGGDGQPIVTHGHTLTSKIKFSDVIDVINQYGFIYSPYPIILSIENHCGHEQTQKMSNIIQLTIGFRLYRIPENHMEFSYYKSPHDLKYKVIVKSTSKLELLKEFAPKDDKHKNFQDDMEWNQLFRLKTQSSPQKDLENKLMHQQSQTLNKNFDRQKSIVEEFNTDINIDLVYNREIQTMEDLDMMMVTHPPSNQSIINTNAPKLDLNHITSCLGGSKLNLDELGKRTIWEISSLDEDKIESLYKDKQQLIVDFHKKFLTRIYPRGTRIDSSNYDPTEYAFSVGAQICALNSQTIDFNYFLNYCKFLENGGVTSGYVLKPAWLSSKCDKPLYPNDFKTPLKQLTIKIISAQQLITQQETQDKETVDPYITVQVRGHKMDVEKNKVQKTITVPNNCINPQFKEQQMIFNLYCPDLALIIFQVYDDNILKDKVILWYGLPFNCIRKGYRIVPLLDKDLKVIEHSYIFVHVDIKDV